MTWLLKVSEFTFDFLLVYSTGSKRFLDLFLEYKDTQVKLSKMCLGKKIFTEVTKFLSKKGESKTELSTYYMKLAHTLSLFTSILQRLNTMEELKSIK